MDTSKLTLGTRVDLARSVKGEMGCDICSEIGFVTATADNGQRFAHPSTFEVVGIGYDEFPFSYTNKKGEAALEQCLKDQQALQEADKLSLDEWCEIDPVYGSESWGPEQEWEMAMLEKDAGY